ncbi:MAG: hypothetical protein P8X64_11610 [Anaerolineales bacterium]
MTISTPEIPSIKDTRLLFDLLGVLEFPKQRVFFVLNRMDRKSGITAEAVSENLKVPVDGEVPFDEKAVASSINRGTPLLLNDKGQPVARNLLSLLGDLKERLLQEEVVEEEEEAEKPRLFNR